MSFRFKELKIKGMFLVEPTVLSDGRGFFLESYKRSAFRIGGIEEEFVQDNFARSAGGVLRGLHFQTPPRAQGKLVRVCRGCVFDVGVDLRVGSPTYGQWAGEELDGESGKMLYLPPGLAHGYCVISDEADLAYKVTDEFASDLDTGLAWNDPDIGVDWPITKPILSKKDLHLPPFAGFESPFVL